ncbi:MbeB family mobilization protein, partial [Neisseria gonorrhoeae]
MSKISDLAKTFEQTSRTEAASIEQQTKADLETLRKNINEALKQSEQKITADINARQLRMSKAVFKPY